MSLHIKNDALRGAIILEDDDRTIKNLDKEAEFVKIDKELLKFAKEIYLKSDEK